VDRAAVTPRARAAGAPVAEAAGGQVDRAEAGVSVLDQRDVDAEHIAAAQELAVPSSGSTSQNRAAPAVSCAASSQITGSAGSSACSRAPTIADAARSAALTRLPSGLRSPAGSRCAMTGWRRLPRGRPRARRRASRRAGVQGPPRPRGARAREQRRDRVGLVQHAGGLQPISSSKLWALTVKGSGSSPGRRFSNRPRASTMLMRLPM